MNWKEFEKNLSCPIRSTKTVYFGGKEEDCEIPQTEYPLSRLDSNCVFQNANLGPFRYTALFPPCSPYSINNRCTSKQSVILSTHRAILCTPLFLMIRLIRLSDVKLLFCCLIR